MSNRPKAATANRETFPAEVTSQRTTAILPAHMAVDPALSKDQQAHALAAMEQDARQLSTATAEGMGGGEPTRLHEVLVAKNTLDLPADSDSGGPLFNRRGEVIGIDTALLSPTAASAGLGFAIPANDARFVAEWLLRDGRFRQGYIGIQTEPVTQDVAAALGMPQPVGAIVAVVRAGEPAEAAGLQVGDVIVRYDDQPVANERSLLRNIARTPIGHAVPLTVLRAGHEQDLRVTPADWPEPITTIAAETPKPPTLVPPDLGLSLSALTADVRARHGLQTQRGGVLVDDVVAGTDAFNRGLKTGDVILRVQNTEVGSPQVVQAAIDAARAEHRAFALMLVLSKEDQLTGPRWVPLVVEVTP